MDGGQRLRVVGGELRKHRVGRRQQLARAGEVGDVGVDLAREDRETVEAVDLRALDLAVPIGALDQPDHQPVPRAAARGRSSQSITNGAALLIGLDDEADAVPAGEVGIEAQRLQQVERQLQPVGFLGVDVEADVVAPRQHRQRLQARQQFGHHALALRAR